MEWLIGAYFAFIAMIGAVVVVELKPVSGRLAVFMRTLGFIAVVVGFAGVIYRIAWWMVSG